MFVRSTIFTLRRAPPLTDRRVWPTQFICSSLWTRFWPSDVGAFECDSILGTKLRKNIVSAECHWAIDETHSPRNSNFVHFVWRWANWIFARLCVVGICIYSSSFGIIPHIRAFSSFLFFVFLLPISSISFARTQRAATNGSQEFAYATQSFSFLMSRYVRSFHCQGYGCLMCECRGQTVIAIWKFLASIPQFCVRVDRRWRSSSALSSQRVKSRSETENARFVLLRF